jgi:hypothetical protein
MSYALDMTNGKIYLFKNGTLMGGTFMFSGITGTMYPAFGDEGGAAYTYVVNFGASAFSYYTTCQIGGSSLASLGFVQGVY